MCVHHLQDALRGKHLGGVSRPGDERVELSALARLERREHVVGHVTPAVPAPDPQPKPTRGTGLYSGEQDMFVFMIDPLVWAEIEGQAFAPGFLRTPFATQWVLESTRS